MKIAPIKILQISCGCTEIEHEKQEKETNKEGFSFFVCLFFIVKMEVNVEMRNFLAIKGFCERCKLGISCDLKNIIVIWKKKRENVLVLV